MKQKSLGGHWGKRSNEPGGAARGAAAATQAKPLRTMAATGHAELLRKTAVHHSRTQRACGDDRTTQRACGDGPGAGQTGLRTGGLGAGRTGHGTGSPGAGKYQESGYDRRVRDVDSGVPKLRYRET